MFDRVCVRQTAGERKESGEMAREQGVASRQPGGSESLDRADEARRATDYGLRNTDYGAQRPDYGLRTTDDGLDLPSLGPGQVGVLAGDAGFGMTRLGLVLLSDHARTGSVAYLDVRGWLSPIAAWEVGHQTGSAGHCPLSRCCPVGEGRCRAS